jgi:hypothetical protein
MRLVIDNSPEALEQLSQEKARLRALDQMEGPLRDLAGNLMRVVRGAGKPEEILSDVFAVLKASEAYRATTDDLPPPPHALAAMLSIRPEPRTEPAHPLGPNNLLEGECKEAELTVVAGALRVAAARLIGPQVQEKLGSQEMYQGIREIERVRAGERKQTAERWLQHHRGGPRRFTSKTAKKWLDAVIADPKRH